MAYGIQVYHSGQVIFGNGMASAYFVTQGSITVPKGDTTAAIAAEGMTPSNSGEVLLMYLVRGNEYASAAFITFTRGTGSFTFSNSNQNTDYVAFYRIIRV